MPAVSAQLVVEQVGGKTDEAGQLLHQVAVSPCQRLVEPLVQRTTEEATIL
jgi:hypothetical protein